MTPKRPWKMTWWGCVFHSLSKGFQLFGVGSCLHICFWCWCVCSSFGRGAISWCLNIGKLLRFPLCPAKLHHFRCLSAQCSLKSLMREPHELMTHKKIKNNHSWICIYTQWLLFCLMLVVYYPRNHLGSWNCYLGIWLRRIRSNQPPTKHWHSILLGFEI